MKSRIAILFVLCGWISSGMLYGCATMDQSLTLGGAMGAATGTAAALGSYAAAGKSVSAEGVAISAGVGTLLGLVTSYFTHKSVVEDRKAYDADQVEMHFGDLPPSPFIVPKSTSKKGAH